jgi:hypothetical protein
VRLQQVLAELGCRHLQLFGQIYTESVRGVKLRVWIQCMPEMQYI